jgi:hypothetical protein
MATIVLEREHDAEITLPELVAAHRHSGRHLLDLGMGPLVHAVDATAHRSVTIYHGPDVETVRRFADNVFPATQTELWPASTNREDGPAAFRRSVDRAGPGALALVDKRFPVEVEIGVPANNFDPNDWCLNMHGVRYLHSHLDPSRRRMVCLYVAVDVETVIAAYRLIPVEVAHIFRVALDPAVSGVVQVAAPAAEPGS